MTTAEFESWLPGHRRRLHRAIDRYIDALRLRRRAHITQKLYLRVLAFIAETDQLTIVPKADYLSGFTNRLKGRTTDTKPTPP